MSATLELFVTDTEGFRQKVTIHDVKIASLDGALGTINGCLNIKTLDGLKVDFKTYSERSTDDER